MARANSRPHFLAKINPPSECLPHHAAAANLWCRRKQAGNRWDVHKKCYTVSVIAAAPSNKSRKKTQQIKKKHQLQIRLSALHRAQSEGVRGPAEFVTRAGATFSQNRRDMLFFHISLPLKVLWKEPRRCSSSEEPWPSELMFDQLPCFLPKQKATGGNRVYRAQRRSRGPVKSQGRRDARLVLLPASTLQVHVEKKRSELN